MATVTFLTSGTSFTVPTDWNNSNNTIEVIGGGGGGGASTLASTGTGGGAGGYSKVTNLTLTPGASITYAIGVAGASATAGGNTYFNGANLGASSVGAAGGGGGSSYGGGGSGGTPGAGGAAASGVGTVKYSGGTGATANNGAAQGGGGGGAAGLNGDGANGSGGAGGAGDNGSGGAGGNIGAGGGAPAVAGGNGTEYDGTHGSGGGGPGGYEFIGSQIIAAAGSYGAAGGGGGGTSGGGHSGSSGTQGLIIITYTGIPNRYWVGGTSSWNGTAGSKWAVSSGGISGAPEPTALDDVYFDASSGAGTVTVATTTALCKNLSFVGFAGTFAGSTAITISGNFTLDSGMAFTHTGTKTFIGTGAQTITTGGGVITGGYVFNSTGSFTLQDALAITSTGSITLTQGTFNANNFGVFVGSFSSSNSNTRTLSMGSGTWTLNGNANAWTTTTTTNLTFVPSTSTVKLTGVLTADRTFDGGGLTFKNFWNATTGAFAVIMAGSNTFYDIKINAGRSQKFTASTTTHFTTWTVTGTAGNLITLSSTSGGSAFTLFSDLSQVVSSDYLSIQDSTATFS